MGNRAVIAFESMPSIGVYVHWNGGVESVLAFLEAAKQRGRTPGGDPTYALACLVRVIGEFFGRGGDSVGVGPLEILDTDNWDNGLYWVGSNWEITRREHHHGDTRRTVEELSTSAAGDRFSCAEKYTDIVERLTDRMEETA